MDNTDQLIVKQIAKTDVFTFISVGPSRYRLSAGSSNWDRAEARVVVELWTESGWQHLDSVTAIGDHEAAIDKAIKFALAFTSGEAMS